MGRAGPPERCEAAAVVPRAVRKGRMGPARHRTTSGGGRIGLISSARTASGDLVLTDALSRLWSNRLGFPNYWVRSEILLGGSHACSVESWLLEFQKCAPIGLATEQVQPSSFEIRLL